MWRRKLLAWIGLVAWLLLAQAALAAPKRVALVIGNDSYPTMGELNNARNDARAIASKLQTLGFELIGGSAQLDVDSRTGRSLIKQFGERLQAGDVAFFYFAGHGVGGDNTNYLIPVDDQEIAYYEDVPDFALDVRSVLNRMEQRGEGTNILILDACRDRPMRQRTRSGLVRGLGPMRAPSGSFIGYAASPGQKSFDGSGRNGVFTAELLPLLGRPGYTMEDVFLDLTLAVENATDRQQTPMRESNLRGRFYLAEPAAAPDNTAMPREGTLAIGVTPANAQVYIGDDLVGSGNRRLNLPAGRVVVRAEATGYQTLERSVLVQGGQVADVQLPLTPVPPPATAPAVATRPAAAPAPGNAQQMSSSASADANGFVDRGGGVLFDTRTGLEWTQRDNGRDIGWDDAGRYCADLSLGGGGWRLPSIKELAAIYGRPNGGTVACGGYTCKVSPLFRLTKPWPWSGTQRGSSKAWFFSLNNGNRTSVHASFSAGTRALCVRRRS